VKHTASTEKVTQVKKKSASVTGHAETHIPATKQKSQVLSF